MVRGFGEFRARSARVPMLWVFSENRAAAVQPTPSAPATRRFPMLVAAPLRAAPPLDVDGHFVHNKPELWRQALRRTSSRSIRKTHEQALAKRQRMRRAS